MAYLITGSDRHTSQTVQFVSNAANELLAKKSADALGVDVTSMKPIADFILEPPEMPQLVPPTIKWSGDWTTVTPAPSPEKRRFGFICAIVGLIIFGLALTDLVVVVTLRNGAAAAGARWVEKRDGHWVSSAKTSKHRVSIGAFAGLLGGAILISGVRCYLSHPPAELDE